MTPFTSNTSKHPELPSDLFVTLKNCAICGGNVLTKCGNGRLDLERLESDPVLSRYVGHRFNLLRCRSCGFMQPSEVPAGPQYFESLYNQQWSEEWMETDFECTYKDEVFRGILRTLESKLPKNRRKLLDVGCHVGRMPYLAGRQGWVAEGIELNPRTAAFAAKRTGLTIHRKNAKELAATGLRFDALLLTDVLEHIPEPISLLRNLCELLAPGGVIAIKVPCAGSQILKQRLRHALDHRQDPDICTNLIHVNHFGPKSLRLAMQQAGLANVHIEIGAPELPPGGGLRGALGRVLRTAAYQVGRTIPFGVHSPLAFNLQAFGTCPNVHS